MIFDNYGAIFLHIGKTAGTAIEDYFAPAKRDPMIANRVSLFGYDRELKIYLQHASLETVCQLAGADFVSQHFTFSIVRNPYSRIVSVFNYALNQYTARFGSFEGFVRALPSASRSASALRGTHLSPQVLYTHENGKQAIDYIGKFEELDAAMCDVQSLLGLDEPILLAPKPKRQVRPGMATIESIKHDLASIIQDVYRSDFELLGYDPAVVAIDQIQQSLQQPGTTAVTGGDEDERKSLEDRTLRDGSRSYASVLAGTIPFTAPHLHRRGKSVPAMTRRSINDWLLCCADPLGAQRRPQMRLADVKAASEMIRQAELHGVLPAVMRNFAALNDNPDLTPAYIEGMARLRTARALVLMLQGELKSIAEAIAGLPAAVVKGPIFADTIYPEPGLRTFSDIDILAGPAALPPLAALLRRRGYELVDEGRAQQRGEWAWSHPENPLLVVEVQTDLVHSLRLKGAFTFTYGDLSNESHSPSGCLMVAAVHGAYHAFERLQHVVDICQAARALQTSEDERHFREIAARPGARIAAIAGLTLAGQLFSEPRCFEVMKMLEPVSGTRLADWLIRRSVILSSKTRARSVHSWRRQAFRLLLRQVR